MSKTKNTIIITAVLLSAGLLLSVGSKAQNIAAKFKAFPLIPNDFNLQGGVNLNLPIQIINQSTFDVSVNNLYITIQNNAGTAAAPSWSDMFYMTSPVKNVLIRANSATNINKVPLTAPFTLAYTIYQIITGAASSNLKVIVRFETVGVELPAIEFYLDAKSAFAPLVALLKKFGLGNLPAGKTAVNNLLPSGNLGYQSNSAHWRKIKNGKAYDKYFPLPEQLEGFAAIGAEPNKTVELMAGMVKKYAYQTAKIAPLLRGKNLTETCKNVYAFMHTFLQYNHDSETAEQLRTPARGWYDGNKGKGIDCDCMTNFAISIFYNLGITCAIKAVSIREDKALQHVYAIVPNGEDPKGYTVVDGCLHQFNNEPSGITNQLIKTIQA